MIPEKHMQWAVDLIKRAQIGKLRGSVTIHFNDGFMVSSETKHNEKAPLDVVKK